MAIRFNINISDETGIEASVLFLLLSEMEQASRYAAADAARAVLAETLPEVFVDAIRFRLIHGYEDLLWIEEIGQGSKWLTGIFLSGVLAATLKSTVGVSVEEGWKQTHSHEAIVELVPEIEGYFLEFFQKQFEERHIPREGRKYEARVAIVTREPDGVYVIKVDVTPRKTSATRS